MNLIEKQAIKFRDSKDELPLISEEDRILFRRLICKQFAEISEVIHFDFVDYEPHSYTTIDEFLPEFKRGIIRINTTGNDSELWGKVYNLMFRAIHDYVHCTYKLDFTYDDEVKAFDEQMWLVCNGSYENYFPALDFGLLSKVLKSEIIYQGAYKTHFGEFHVPLQKIILS